jgi:hypothetical protein
LEVFYTIREKETINEEGSRNGLKEFEKVSYREAVSLCAHDGDLSARCESMSVYATVP